MQSGGRLLIGGSFSQLGGLNRVGLARVRLPYYGFAPLFDFDGDGKTDTAVYRPSVGTWYLLKSREGFSSLPFGISTDRPVPADYDGDGETDIAVFRNGVWYILKSLDGKVQTVLFGIAEDQPVPAAYLTR